jgi:hypothetical protein
MVARCAAHVQQGFYLQKTFCASERLVPLTLHDLQRPAEVFHGGILTEFNTHTKKDGIPLRDIPCFIFHDKVHYRLYT